jgi:hypothetical protein
VDSTALLNLVSALALLAGLIFTGAQIRAAQKQRGREALLQLLQSLRTPEFVVGITIIGDLPDGLHQNEFEARVGEKIYAVRYVLFSLESVGALVQRRDVPIDLVSDFMHGVVGYTWKKTRQYIFDRRQKMGVPTIFEYVQWLAEQLEKRSAQMPRQPAYIAYRDWKP